MIGAIGAVTVAFASSARADFTIRIDAIGFDLNGAAPGTSFDIPDGDPIFDQDATVNGVITVRTLPLNLVLASAGTGFGFTNLGANDISGDPNESALNVNGSVRRIGANGVGLVTVTVSANDFVIPAPGFATMSSTASDTFGGLGSIRTFQSFFDPADIQFGLTVPSPLLVFAPTLANPSTSGNAADTLVTIVGPFALTNVTSIFLAAPNRVDQFTGRTTIRAVPEPGSLALLLMGGAGLTYRLRRRRAIAA